MFGKFFAFETIKKIEPFRVFELVVVPISILLLAPVFLISALLIWLSSRGSVIFWSRRFGKDRKLFYMPKFRTMYTSAPLKDTNSLENPASFVTPVGSVLRYFSVDELPQLWSVLVGDMSLVGPRPALETQLELVALREKFRVNSIKPGITGLAQINGRDGLTDEQKVMLDSKYLEKKSFIFDVSLIIKTIPKVFSRAGITH